MSSRETYEVFAIRYASHSGHKAREFYRYDVYGESDQETQMDYYFWLIRNEHRTVLVDTGLNAQRSAARGRYLDHEPSEALRRLDVDPADLPHVIVSHMHYDHIGNLQDFPAALVSVAGAEFDFWTGPYGRREVPGWSVHQDEVAAMVDLEREGRLHLIEDETATLFPGIRTVRLGGHSPGQLIVDVDTAGGRVVLASDAMHYYEEIERDRPFFVFTDLVELYRGYETLRALAATDGVTVVAGHDPLVMSRFPRLTGDAADLAVRLD